MSRKFWFIVYAVTLVLAILSAIFLPTPVKAATIQGSEEACVTMAQDVQYAADMRDAGWSHEVVSATVTKLFIEASLGDVGASYIRDEDDAEMFRSVMKTVWKATGMSGKQLSSSFYKYCMQRGV